MDIPTRIWSVIDEDSDTTYTSTHPDDCHDHINETLMYHGNEDAKEWVVREYVLADEIERLQADAEFKRVLVDALVTAHIYTSEHESDPSKALHALLSWEIAVALDPRVSNEAAALVTAARKQERERCANACKPPKICGHQGFAGPSCCVLPPGHSVPHEYSEPTIWTARDCENAIRALEDE